MSKDQFFKFFKFLKNPLWIIVILLIVMIFQMQGLNKNVNYLEGHLWEIQNELGWIKEALGTPSDGLVMKYGINERLVEILDKLEQILYKLR